MPIGRAAQKTLFQCQLWHLHKAKDLERVIRYWGRDLHGADESDVKQTLRCLRRRLTVHERFINAITPFVRSPIGQ